MSSAQATRAARQARARRHGARAPTASGQSGLVEVIVLGGLTLVLLAGGGAVAAIYGGAGFGQVKVVEGSFAPTTPLDYSTRGGAVAAVSGRGASSTVIQAPPTAVPAGGR